MVCPWFGPLSLAHPEVIAALDAIPSYRALALRGLVPRKTLLYVPRKDDPSDLDLFVLARMFAWDDRSPVVWLLSTVGLCAIEQPVRANRAAFRRFELVVAARPATGADLDDPFPARLGVVLSAEDEMAGSAWDWNQVVHPPLVRWLARTGQEFAHWIRGGEHFAIPDTLAYGPGGGGGEAWTQSRLTQGALLPASVHMLLSGYGPFNEPADPADAMEPGAWHREPGTERFEYGSYWFLPLSAKEHAAAEADGTWSAFADLAEAAPQEARDDCLVAFDWLR